MSRSFSLLLCLTVLLSACTERTDSDNDNSPSDEVPSTLTLDRLEAFLTGRFDSSLQSVEQPQYYPIQLLTCAVEAPGLGGRVLYVEQASMDSLNAPYRQRLYVLESDEEMKSATTTVYSMVEPGDWIGLCDEAGVVTIDADEVEIREGCGVQLLWDGDTGSFEGGTVGEACSSTLGGASYATSEVLMSQDYLHSWDRGFDANGFQAWGATDGPYEFLRQSE